MSTPALPSEQSLVPIGSFRLPFRASPPIVLARDGPLLEVVAVDLDLQASVLCSLDAHGVVRPPVRLEMQYPTGACVEVSGLVVTGVMADGAPIVVRVAAGSGPSAAVPLPRPADVLRAARPIRVGGQVHAVWETFSGHGSNLWACAVLDAESGSAGPPTSLPFTDFSAHLETSATDDAIVVARVAGPAATAQVLWLSPDLRILSAETLATGASTVGVAVAGDHVCAAWVADHGAELVVQWFDGDRRPKGKPRLLARTGAGGTFASLRLAGDSHGRVAFLHRTVSRDQPRDSAEQLSVVGVDAHLLGSTALDQASAGGRVAGWLGERVVVLPANELDVVRLFETPSDGGRPISG